MGEAIDDARANPDRVLRDYVSPNLVDLKPDRFFPHMVKGDPQANLWNFLRREIPHTWYVDGRFPIMGFVSRDEAAILHNSALMFSGEPALEIGCWRGFSTAHLAAAGLVLDVIDPILSEQNTMDEMKKLIADLGAESSVSLHGGFSEQLVYELAERKQRWRFIFIDGDHEAPAPARDAALCAQYAADDAMIVLHDLASPAVADGLELLRELGWSTAVYQTMQIMGVAWRGDIQPLAHTPDPQVSWQLPPHLRSFRLVHESAEDYIRRLQPLITELIATEKAFKTLVEHIDGPNEPPAWLHSQTDDSIADGQAEAAANTNS